MFYELAPAGNFPSPFEVLHTACSVMPSVLPWNAQVSSVAVFSALENALRAEFEGTEIAFYSSGSAALCAILRHLRERYSVTKVAVGAYTCPDVIVAAMSAGFEIVIVDLIEQTLQPRFEMIDDPSSVVVVLSNLYGLPDRLPSSIAEMRVVVDDGCQASLSSTAQGVVGFRAGTVGVLSFGRGKGLCGVGGGAVVASKGTPEAIQSIVRVLKTQAAQSVNRDYVGPLLRNMIYSVLERPHLYWIPRRVPWFKLGKVRVAEGVVVSGCAIGEAIIALAQMGRIKSTREVALKAARRWHEALSGVPVIEPFVEGDFLRDGNVVPTRYPLLLPSEHVRDRVERRLQQAGIGATRSYGKTVRSFFPAIRATGATTGAEGVAKKLLTLPTHRYVQMRDVDCAIRILREELIS